LNSLVLLGIGGTIGGGVFTLSGIAARLAGAYLWISWLISGVITMLSAMIFAELSSKIQRSGSSYIYAYIISGELMAWFIGWNVFMQYGICASV
jgi:APA family basic amino acid/polyamine antiporter